MEKSIVVTGAGHGIGRAIAKLLAEQGYSLLPWGVIGRILKAPGNP